MNIAGVTVRPESVQLLAKMLGGELGAKLDRAVANNNSIVSVNRTDRERIVAVLGDEMPAGLGELRSVLVKQLARHQRQDAQHQQARNDARARAQTSRA